jgi:SAM-dependent methyltransferase
MLELVRGFGIRPTLFATHRSEFIQHCEEDELAQIGVHPNFLPNSTHGTSYQEVIHHITRLFPNSNVFRSHSFFDNSHVSKAFWDLGYRYDSNLCLYLQADIQPLHHSTGLIRMPVFWEDDVHWHRSREDWKLENYVEAFLSPGLKIINVHPIHMALNTPSVEFYQSVPKRPGDLRQVDIAELRNSGPGTRSFLESLLKTLTAQGHRFYTLAELFSMFSSDQEASRRKLKRAGSRLSEEQHANYWSSDSSARQLSLRKIYDERDPTDPYATSRDANQRELEIEAITRSLTARPPGCLVDLGCGNGYTLISLAKELEDWNLTGVDFSQVLIGGAARLLEQNARELVSTPAFARADAVEYVRGLPAQSVDVFVTERFLLNLPDAATQREVIRNMHRALRPGGLLLMCEGSMEGFRGLNRMRTAMGLAPILETSADNLSAIRFEDEEIESFACKELDFSLLDKAGFSTFFVISRVLHPALVAPQAPKFDARINTLARELQLQVPFEPGIGSNVLWTLQKPAGGASTSRPS